MWKTCIYAGLWTLDFPTSEEYIPSNKNIQYGLLQKARLWFWCLSLPQSDLRPVNYCVDLGADSRQGPGFMGGDDAVKPFWWYDGDLYTTKRVVIVQRFPHLRMVNGEKRRICDLSLSLGINTIFFSHGGLRLNLSRTWQTLMYRNNVREL